MSEELDATLPGVNFRIVWDDVRAGLQIGGQYEIRGLLGEGGMGRVFEATDLGLRRTVAIKVSKFPELDSSLEQEGRALAAIEHAGLPRVYALGHHGPRAFLVMEMIRGLSLARHIEERQERALAFGIEEAIDVLLRIAKPLSLVHDAGVAHRDVKPANVMMAGERVVVMDFGLVAPEYEIGRDRLLMGSPPYMAPEIINLDVRPGRAYCADIYALGLVAHELLTFSNPFDGEEVQQILFSHVTKQAPDVRELRPDVPPALAELIQAMVAKDPFERPNSMQDISWELQQIRNRLNPASEPHLPILVVDDDSEYILPLIRGFLEQWVPGVRVECLSDPVVATERLAHQSYGLMLLDLNMPTMSGLELLMYMRGSLHAKDAPEIVVVSSQLDSVDPALLRSLGVISTVGKGPLLEAQLKELVLRWAGRSHRYGAARAQR